MRTAQSYCATVLALVVLQSSLSFGAVRGEEVKYVGGTLSAIPQETEGHLDINNEMTLKFTCKKGAFEVPYENITSLEFGQKAGRRLGVGIMVTPFALHVHG
jgi:hypothetical protein